jgi:hypothetical protein
MVEEKPKLCDIIIVEKVNINLLVHGNYGNGLAKR